LVEDKEEKELKKEKFIEPKYSKCHDCSKSVNVKGGLVCDHTICKHCLIKTVLKSFLKKEPYKYLCFCSNCHSKQKLSAFLLDCGCIWRKIGGRIMNKANDIDYGKCDSQHKLNSIDFCLVNDFVSLGFVYSMIFDYLAEIDQQISFINNKIAHQYK